MILVLVILMVVDVGVVTATITMGVLLDTGESVGQHLLSGIGTTMFLTLTHLLVMFYLIGTGKDIKEALEGHPDLAAEHVPAVRSYKMRAFPLAFTSIVLIITAALLGGEVHSRLLVAVRPPADPPLRDVPFWWVHLTFVSLAIVVSAVAMARELKVVRDNRRTIEAINRELSRRENGAEG